MGVTSFVLGLIGLLLSIVPIIGVYGLVLTIPGIIEELYRGQPLSEDDVEGLEYLEP